MARTIEIEDPEYDALKEENEFLKDENDNLRVTIDELEADLAELQEKWDSKDALLDRIGEL